jgi:UDP-glucose 4-epimerase
VNWKDRRVLVTGADGFIGSHLAEALVSAGAQVRAFCLYNSRAQYGWLNDLDESVHGELELWPGDIRDERLVERACEGVDTVFHLAALIAIPYSYQAPASFVDTNVRGTLNVLEASRRRGCRRLVHTSTSEVYGTPDILPILESHPLKAQSPYSASKLAADKLCEAFHCSFDMPVVVLRPFNTFGPRQSARAVIPTILSQLLHGRTRVALGNLDARRDLTFVSDTVRAFLSVGLATGVEGETVQLGSGLSSSVQEVFELACGACGVQAIAVQDPERLRPDKSEVMALQSDPSLAADLLGWRTDVTLQEGLARTADWMANHLDQYPPEVYAI